MNLRGTYPVADPFFLKGSDTSGRASDFASALHDAPGSLARAPPPPARHAGGRCVPAESPWARAPPAPASIGSGHVGSCRTRTRTRTRSRTRSRPTSARRAGTGRPDEISTSQHKSEMENGSPVMLGPAS